MKTFVPQSSGRQAGVKIVLKLREMPLLFAKIGYAAADATWVRIDASRVAPGEVPRSG
jgi:hypothetical protein